MKTHVIQLEPHDDVISIRDKMTWGKTGRILLVWPKKNPLRLRRLDLQHLQRHAITSGLQLAIITGDWEIKKYAGGLSIPVFRDTRRAMAARWKAPRRLRLPRRPGGQLQPGERQNLRQASPRKAGPPSRLLPLPIRLAALTFSILALLALAAALLPGATIALSPDIQTQEIFLPVTANISFTQATYDTLPAQWLSVVVEGRITVSATGATLLPENTATGGVRFTNMTSQAVTIPSGVELQTTAENPIRFITISEVKLPAGNGKSAIAAIRAVNPGKAGNIPAGSIGVIVGGWGYSATVTNPQSTGGGSDLSVAAPTYADRLDAYNQLISDLQKTASDELRANLRGFDMLLTSEPELVSQLVKQYEPEAGLPGATLTLTLRLEFRALAVSGERLQQLSEAALNASLPEGYAPLPGTLEIVALTRPAIDAADTASWKLIARRSLRANISVERAVAAVLGKPPEQATASLEAVTALENTPVITLWPYWWPRLPLAPFRIVVVSE